jgi:hypothetical protein
VSSILAFLRLYCCRQSAKVLHRRGLSYDDYQELLASSPL